MAVKDQKAWSSLPMSNDWFEGMNCPVVPACHVVAATVFLFHCGSPVSVAFSISSVEHTGNEPRLTIVIVNQFPEC